MPIIDIGKINQEVNQKYLIKDNTFFITPKDDLKDLVEVEIGDSKQPDKFVPQIKICRWGNKDGTNEVNCSIRLNETEIGIPKISTLQDKIIWEKGNIKAYFYELTEGEGGYEFEIILKEKPLTNRIEFTLVDKGVEYFYQPELTPEEIAQGAFRPENVVGSYAVYASEQKTNWEGGKEYKCGQVGMIFRPKIIDSVGNWTWEERTIDIEKGVMTITIPQDFLNKAVYPIRSKGVDFGYTTQGGSSVIYGADEINAHGDTYTGGAGTGTSMSFYGSGYTASRDIQMALYTNASPSVKVTNGSTVTVAITTTNQWWTANFSIGPTISASEYYLTFNRNGDTNLYYNVLGTNGVKYIASTYKTWPNTITWSAYGSVKKFSIYATYTAAGGAPPVTAKGNLLLMGVG